jgi:ATP-dependent DNA helicase RecQ
MIEFCHTEYCYRAAILDYFGDRHHARQCGTCGNCTPHSAARTPLAGAEMLSDVLGARAPSPARTRIRNRQVGTASSGPTPPRALTDDENLRVRKILACASRLKARFGKNMLAATLRGSAAKNVLHAHLNELSTYGLLKDMRQDDILLFIEALCDARCLRVSPGEYPTISITELGERVMREQERVELALADDGLVHEEEPLLPNTALQTYTLFRNGHSVEEIASQRNLVTKTIEGHLIECIAAGLPVDVSKLVSDSDRAQIEKAIAAHGTEKLKPIRGALPESITYNTIRFVVALREKAK